jgi:hypothetical protein
MLRQLGFNEGIADDDGVAILVYPNGSGKSRFLEKIGEHYQDLRPVCVVSNTPSLRLNSLRKAKRFAVGRIGKSPKSVIKAAGKHTRPRQFGVLPNQVINEVLPLRAAIRFPHAGISS